jgi:uncharacterized protein (TIGR02145 family)
MKSYYCVVKNGTDSVVSSIADVAIGCGAKTADGAWLKFMCYNLGVITNANSDPFTFAVNDSSILGKFYQWGRPDANYRAANNVTNFTTSSAYPYDWKISNGYKTTISDLYHQDDYLWRNHKNGVTDPCPDGWHVPSQSAFGAIFKGTADADIPGNAIANTWTPTGSWSWSDATNYGNGGYAVKPDGVTTTLFFPAAGCRSNETGVLSNVSLLGYYWSGSVAANGAFLFHFNGGMLFPGRSDARGFGISVRCISDSI